MGLRLGTKIYWFVQNPKNSSYVPSTVTVMYGTFLKRIQNFRNMPFSKNIELCVTVSVLEAVDVHLSDKKGLMVIGKYFFFKFCSFYWATFTQIAQILSRTLQIPILKLFSFVQG